MPVIHLVNIIPGVAKEDLNHPPLGLLYVGTSLAGAGYDVKIHQILPEDIEPLSNEIIKDHPLFVGFSVTTGLSSFYSATMSKLLKSRDPAIRVVWGGWHPSLATLQCLKEEYIDIVCIGEGERTAVELADFLQRGSSLDSVRSIGYKVQSVARITRPRQLEDNIDVFDFDPSILNYRPFLIRNNDKLTTSFFSSRGCPFDCAFCCTPSLCKRRWRAHSVDYIVRHLVDLKNRFGINDVYFSDDNFFVDRARALSTIRRLRGEGISCSTLDVRLDSLNKNMLDELVRFGATGIFFGWESGSDRLLTLIHKRITREQIISSANLLSKYPEIAVWGSGIVALPTETRSDYNSTVEMALMLLGKIPKGTISLFRYMPLPGTEALDWAVRDGFGMPEDTIDWARVDPRGPSYDVTWIPWMTDKDKHNTRMTQEYMRNVIRKIDPNGNKLFNTVQTVFNGVGSLRVRNQTFYLPIDYDLYSAFRKTWEFARNAKDLIATTAR